MVTETHPTRLKDIKLLIEQTCEINWSTDAIQVVMPQRVWRQTTVEEVMLIVFGREYDTEVQTIVDPSTRVATLEFANCGKRLN